MVAPGFSSSWTPPPSWPPEIPRLQRLLRSLGVVLDPRSVSRLRPVWPPNRGSEQMGNCCCRTESPCGSAEETSGLLKDDSKATTPAGETLVRGSCGPEGDDNIKWVFQSHFWPQHHLCLNLIGWLSVYGENPNSSKTPDFFEHIYTLLELSLFRLISLKTYSDIFGLYFKRWFDTFDIMKLPLKVWPATLKKQNLLVFPPRFA